MSCLLVTSEATLKMWHQYGCLQLISNKGTQIDFLTWMGKKSHMASTGIENWPMILTRMRTQLIIQYGMDNSEIHIPKIKRNEDMT